MKFTKLLLLGIVSLSLIGCDLSGGGEGEVDPTLYELKLTTNLDKAKDKIKAELSRERDNDEVQELIEAGASQEDINKAGTCIDGTYYFFDQDPINLYEPFIPGYEFLGWYNGNEFLGYLDTDYDGNPNYIWNMLDKNTTLEARFKLMQFEILYMDEGTTQVDPAGNPTSWNVEDGEVALKSPTKEGFQFDGWSFAMGGNTRYEGYVTKLNEDFLIASNIAKQSMEGRESMTFSLHENFSVIKHNVKLTFDSTYINNVYINVKEPGSSVFHDFIDGQHWVQSGVSGEIVHNSEVVIHATPVDSDLYEISGIYFNGYKISEKLSNNEYKIIASQDAEVVIRWAAKF